MFADLEAVHARGFDHPEIIGWWNQQVHSVIADAWEDGDFDEANLWKPLLMATPA